MSLSTELKDDELSIGKLIKKQRKEKGLTVYSCTGTPVDCVKLAIVGQFSFRSWWTQPLSRTVSYLCAID